MYRSDDCRPAVPLPLPVRGKGLCPQPDRLHRHPLLRWLTLTALFLLAGCASLNLGPGPKANPGGPYIATVGTPINFTGGPLADSTGKAIANYAWTFGDGATATGQAPVHSYNTPGTYTVLLVVTTSDQRTSAAQTTAKIDPISSVAGVRGAVHGGQQPISGATVQLWQIGFSGYGAGALPLGTSVQTDGNGYFNITGDYHCSDAVGGVDTPVYITSAGGNPGLSDSSTNNTAATMMVALGPCSSLTAATSISIDEVTTVASVYALAQFMDATGKVGTYGSTQQGLLTAFANVSNLVDIAQGTARAVTPNGNGVVPQIKLNTLGDVLSPCVNSEGPASNACVALFAAATPPGGSAPSTIIGAARDIALNPGNNATPLVMLPTGDAPFQPLLSAANDWTITLGFGSGGAAPSALAVDSTGNIWVANYGTGGATSSVSLLTPLGVPAANSPFSAATINGVSSLAIDGANNVWLANRDNSSAAELSSSLSGSTYTIAPVSGPYTSGISSPSSIAVDAFSNVWLVNSGSNSLTELPHGNYGAPASVLDVSLSNARSIAFDIFANAWVSTGNGASVTRLNPTAAPIPFASFNAIGQTAPAGLAIDSAANVWVTDSGQGVLAKLDRNGIAVSPANGFTNGGISGSAGDAIDGSGNVWVADTAGNRLSELSSSGVALSPATGFQDPSLSAPVSVAVDASGNVWVANSHPVSSGSFPITVSEVIGAAAPAITPLSTALAHAALGLRPGTPQPTANAGGPYSAVADTAIAFSGSASTDPNSEALTYVWSFGDGTLGSGATSTHTYNSAGNYTVILTVTDTGGRSGQAVVTAAISAAPVQNPVVVTGGPYSGDAYTAVTFNGNGSYDPSNITVGSNALTLTWNFGDGSSGAGPYPVHTYTASGTYTVTLSATTASGGSANASTTAVIADATAPAGAPIANAGGPYSGSPGATVTFSSAGSSDPNSLALTYNWSFGDGGSSTDANPTYAYTTGGTYSVVLTVSNSTTSSTVSTVAVISTPPVAPLRANAGGPYTVPILQPQVFDGTQTVNPTGHQLSYTWDFGDGLTGIGSNPIHVYGRANTYTVSLSVNDSVTGTSSTATTQATVTAPPAEAITANAGGPYQNVTGQNITFNAATSSDNLGNALTYTWNFGDGATGSGSDPNHAYATSGHYTATVTATSGTVTSMATAAVTITNALGVTITSPAPSQLFATNAITVSGTTSAPNLNVTVNGVAATINGTSFTANNVSLREGVNLISATATDSSGGVGTGVVSVILDATAPQVSITSPAANSTITTAQVAVAGLVNDIVTGTVGSNNVTVTVNGQPAQVANRSYLLPSLQLVPGTNTLTVVATDNVGNVGQTTETMQLLPATSQLSLQILSGNSQSAAVQTVLPQPLVVQLVSATGTPIAGRPISFAVTRSDGVVEVMPSSAQTLTVTTDTNGKASVLFKLGSRSGLGINQVSATTPGAAAAALFTETSTTGPPTQIHVVTGDNQRGLLGEQLAEAFQAIVQDAAGNPVQGVTVNYTAQGATDGTFDNPNPVTDANGKVTANLTLGQQEGIQNYITSADFAGDTASAAVSFVASAYAPGPVANTSVSGIVLDTANAPVPNATVTITGTSLSTITNTSGYFQITGAPVGTIIFTVDGSSATTTETLPFLSFVLEDLPGQNNSLPHPIYLPSIDVNDAQTVGGTDPVTLTMAGVPGLAFTVAPNSVTFPDGSTVGKLSISQVKSDEVPMEPSNGTAPNLIWTLQPAGTRFSVPVQVTLPNTLGLPPGYVSEFYQYDHDLEQFASAGTAHVSADGSVLVSDPGFGITKAGWGHGSVPNSPFGCAASCISTNPCISSTWSPSHCLCIDKVLTGQACGANIPLEIGDGVFINLSCVLPGHCTANSQCDGGFQRGGMPCQREKPDVCIPNTFCNGNGKCIDGTRIPDVTTAENPSQDYGTVTSNIDRAVAPLRKLLGLMGSDTQLTVAVAGNIKKTLHCCSETQTTDVPITETSLNPSVTIAAPPFPLAIPTAPPVLLFLNLPTGQVLGFTGQIGASFGVTFGGKDDECKKTNCLTLAANADITFTVAATLPFGSLVEVSASVDIPVSIGLGGGCGQLTYFFGLKPWIGKGKLKLFNNTDYTVTRTIYSPTLNINGTIPLE